MAQKLESPDVAATRLAALRLALVPGVGPRTRQKLLAQFGTPEAVFEAAPSDLRAVERVGPKLCRAIAVAKDEIDVEAEIELCRGHGIEIVAEQDENYPKALRDLPDPPGVLFVRGN